MAKIDFINGLKALGYNPQEPRSDFVTFEYKIPNGRFLEQKVLIGFQVDDSFPGIAPHGPHFNKKLLTPSSSGIHNSPLGNEWEHWSRPFNEWNQTDRSVKTYMAHIRNVLNVV